MGRKAVTATAEEMLELRKKGMTNEEIAKELSCAKITVYRRIGKQPEEMTTANHVKAMNKAREALDHKNVVEDVVEEQKSVTQEQVEVETPPSEPVEPKKKAPTYMLDTDFTGFAYRPNLYEKLHDLKEMAQPEIWRFVGMNVNENNYETPLLELHIGRVYRFLANLHNQTPAGEDGRIIQIKGGIACFHTGLYTPELKGIYARFSRNRLQGRQPWVLNAFGTDTEDGMRKIHPLPEPPIKLLKSLSAFRPEWDIRVSVEHILRDAKNVERIPESLRDNWNMPMILWASIEHSRRRARIEPGIVVPAIAINLKTEKIENYYQLPLWLTNPDAPDLVLAAKEMDGYYGGFTCLTPEQAYINARLYGRPTVKWLVDLVGGTGE